MIINFDHIKIIHREAEVNDKYKVLFDKTKLTGRECTNIRNELCQELAEQFNISDDDYIMNIIPKKEG